MGNAGKGTMEELTGARLCCTMEFLGNKTPAFLVLFSRGFFLLKKVSFWLCFGHLLTSALGRLKVTLKMDVH